jgi:hypothetical protein
MVSARTQLRVVAAVYAVFGAPLVALIGLILFWASITPPELRQYAESYTRAIPLMASLAIGYFALSGLSLRFLRLGLSWRIATIAVSVILSLLAIWRAARASAVDISVHLAMGRSYSALLLLGLWWGLALLYSVCSYLLWQQIRTSNNRSRGP